jgi:hypothetical protein
MSKKFYFILFCRTLFGMIVLFDLIYASNQLPDILLEGTAHFGPGDYTGCNFQVRTPSDSEGVTEFSGDVQLTTNHLALFEGSVEQQEGTLNLTSSNSNLIPARHWTVGRKNSQTSAILIVNGPMSLMSSVNETMRIQGHAVLDLRNGVLTVKDDVYLDDSESSNPASVILRVDANNPGLISTTGNLHNPSNQIDLSKDLQIDFSQAIGLEGQTSTFMLARFKNQPTLSGNLPNDRIINRPDSSWEQFQVLLENINAQWILKVRAFYNSITDFTNLTTYGRYKNWSNLINSWNSDDLRTIVQANGSISWDQPVQIQHSLSIDLSTFNMVSNGKTAKISSGKTLAIQSAGGRCGGNFQFEDPSSTLQVITPNLLDSSFQTTGNIKGTISYDPYLHINMNPNTQISYNHQLSDPRFESVGTLVIPKGVKVFFIP